MKKLALILFLTVYTLSAFSQEHVVKMLNAGKEGMMVLSQQFFLSRKVTL